MLKCKHENEIIHLLAAFLIGGVDGVVKGRGSWAGTLIEDPASG